MLLLICLGIWLISASGQTDAEPNFGARGAAWPILRLVQVSTSYINFLHLKFVYVLKTGDSARLAYTS